MQTKESEKRSVLSGKFEQIDCLRFFAVFLVLCMHWDWPGIPIINQLSIGHRGVEIFFTISGFLITLGLIRVREKGEAAKTSLYHFYIRRFLRIFPIYYLTIALVWFFDHSRLGGALSWHLLYLSNFYSIRIGDWGGMGHLWSLSVEEQFYLVWPLIILLTPRMVLPYAISLAILVSILFKSYWQLHGNGFWYIYMHPLGALDALGIGALLSYFLYFHAEILKKIVNNPNVIFFVCLQLVACIYAQFTTYQTFYMIGIRGSVGLFSAWLIGKSVFKVEGIMGYILNSGVLRYIGKISYGIYLFHPLVPDLFMHTTDHLNGHLRFFIYLTTTIGLASFSWYIFEKPLLKLKERFA